MCHHGKWLGSKFFMPELVMRHQQEIGLTPDQQTALRDEAVKFAGHVTDLRWQESASQETLASLLKQDKLDEKAVMAEQEKLLKIKDDITLSHMAMLIHIKNMLTPEQQAKLTEIMKHRMEHHAWGAHGMWHPGMGQMDGQPAVGPRLGIRPGGERLPVNAPPAQPQQ
jgi:Spy/CpxP family protein refolding chaperone